MRTADALGYVIGALEREAGPREAHRAVWSAADRAGICGVEAIDDGCRAGRPALNWRCGTWPGEQPTPEALPDIQGRVHHSAAAAGTLT